MSKFGATPYVELSIGGKALDATLMRYATKLEISEARDMMDQLVVTFSLPQVESRYKLIDMVEPGVEYKLKVTAAETSSIEYQGYVQGIKHTLGRTGAWTVEITGLDGLVLLKRNRPPKKWASLKEALETIASEAGLDGAKIQGYNATETELYQESDEDLTFLAKYAKSQGFVLRVAEKTLYFTRRDLPDSSAPAKLTWKEDILTMNLQADIGEVYTEVHVAAHNYVQDKAILAKSTDSDLKGVSSTKSLATKFAKTCFGKRILIMNNDSDAETSAMKDKAKAKMIAGADSFVSGDITCIGHPEIVAGSVVEITDGTWPLTGKFLISKATHSIMPGVGLRTKLTFTSDSLPDK